MKDLASSAIPDTDVTDDAPTLDEVRAEIRKLKMVMPPGVMVYYRNFLSVQSNL